MTKPIAFIIGAGKNIGLSTAAILQSRGYRIALAARSLKPQDSTTETLHLALDLSKPEAVGPVFASLRKQWGEPSVVFYNGVYHPKTISLFPVHSLTLISSCSSPLHFPHRPAGPFPRGFRPRPRDQYYELVRRDQRVRREFRNPPCFFGQESFPLHGQHPQHRANADFADARGWESRFGADRRAGCWGLWEGEGVWVLLC